MVTLWIMESVARSQWQLMQAFWGFNRVKAFVGLIGVDVEGIVLLIESIRLHIVFERLELVMNVVRVTGRLSF